MKLGIIILNWNDADTSLQCLRIVFSWRSIDTEIIVVDNASSDDSVKSIVAEFPDIHLVQSETNCGFAGGNNLGITKALEVGCDAVLMLNSDAEISEDDVTALIRRLEDSTEPIIIGPAIEEKSATGSVLTCGGRDMGRFSRTRITAGDGNQAYSGRGRPGSRQELHEVGYVPGTVLLAPVSVFDKVGLLDEDYFFSGEIADFCARARLQGIKSMIDMSVTAHHGDENEVKPLRGSLYIYYTLRNRFLYVSKHGGSARLWLKFIWIIKGFCMFGISIIKLDFKRARAVALGLSDGLFGKWGNRNEMFGV